MQIYKAVTIIRSDMFIVTFRFDGSFPVHCEENSVPRSLVTLVNLLLYRQAITTGYLLAGNTNDCLDVNIQQLQTNP